MGGIQLMCPARGHLSDKEGRTRRGKLGRESKSLKACWAYMEKGCVWAEEEER